MPGGLHPPADVIASWPNPNYVDPERRPHNVLAVSIAFGALATAVLIIRGAVRLGCTRNFGADDALALGAYITSIGLAAACSLGEVDYGFDLHVWDIPLDFREKIRMVTLTTEILFVVSTSLVKLSILVFFQRLTRGLVQNYNKVVWPSIVFVSLQMLGPFLAIFTQCHPLDTFWLQVIPGWLQAHPSSTCFDEGLFLLAITGISVFTDFLLALVPSVMFLRLDVDIRQKLAYVLVFFCGLVLCIIGVLRIIMIYYLYYETYDNTWNANPLFALTVAEPLVGFIIASLPSLKVFFATIVPDYFSFWTGRYYSYGSESRDIEMHDRCGSRARGGSLGILEDVGGKQHGSTPGKTSMESTTLGQAAVGASVIPEHAPDPRALTTWFEFDDEGDEERPRQASIGVAR